MPQAAISCHTGQVSGQNHVEESILPQFKISKIKLVSGCELVNFQKQQWQPIIFLEISWASLLADQNQMKFETGCLVQWYS